MMINIALIIFLLYTFARNSRHREVAAGALIFKIITWIALECIALVLFISAHSLGYLVQALWFTDLSPNAPKYPNLNDILPHYIGRICERTSHTAGCVFNKFGQSISSNPSLGETLVYYFKRLTDRITPMKSHELTKQISNSWIQSSFTSFDYKVGKHHSASMAQVHRAKTSASVGVKVKRDGVGNQISTGLIALKWVISGLCALDHPKINTFVDKLLTTKAPQIHRYMKLLVRIGTNLDLAERYIIFKDKIEKQADFIEEARNLRRFYDRTRGYKHLRTPRPIEELCSENVIVMEWINGVPLHALTREEMQKVVEWGGHRELMGWFMKCLYKDGEVHGDGHSGQILVDMEAKTIGVVDFGDICYIDEESRKTEKRFMELLCLKKYEDAVTWCFDEMCEKRKDTIPDIIATREDILSGILPILTSCLTGTLVDFQSFALQLSHFLTLRGYRNLVKFTAVEIAMFNVQSSLSLICPHIDTWALIKEVAREGGIVFLDENSVNDPKQIKLRALEEDLADGW